MRGGGSERQTLLLLKNLDRERFTPHLYISERAGDLMNEVPEDVTIHSFADAPNASGFYFPGRILRQQVTHLSELLERESIDVIYDRTFHMTLIAGPAAHPLEIPRVSTIVSPPHRALPLVESRFVWLKKRRIARAYRQSRAVVAVSQQAANSAESYYSLRSGLERGQIKVVLNGVDIEAIRRSSVSENPVRDSRITLVCVGRMTKEKGHRDFIESLAISEANWPRERPPMKIWLVGDGPLRTELESLCREQLQRHEVQFLGTQPNPAPWIAAADALALPSHFEGMPNVVLESMAVGTPVIATRAGGTVELEREKPTILWANPADPKSLAGAVSQFIMCLDNQHLDPLIRAATALVESQHDVKQTTKKIESLLSAT